ncbi:hypothetical protein NQ317_005620, partial [Molorchus minor]
MWKSEIDFENDLEEFSEIEVIRNDYDVTTPQSLLDWEASNGINNHRSVFDVPDFTEDVTYVVSGRGRGGRSTIIRPGVPDRCQQENDIKKLIRQVSGPGYSNELIEQYLVRNKDTKRNYMPHAPKLKQYIAVGLSKAFDRRHTQKTSPSHVPLRQFFSQLHLSESEIVEEEKPSEPAAPLPLCEILRRAKDEAKRKPRKRTPWKIRLLKIVGWAAKNDSGNRDDPSNMWRRRDGPTSKISFSVCRGEILTLNRSRTSVVEIAAL